MNPKKTSNIEGFMLDLDGTLYVSDRLLAGTPRFLATLRRRGLPHLFLTNNSSKSGQNYVDKLNRLGVPCAPPQVFTSGQATALYVAEKTAHRSAYVVGTQALQVEFAALGIRLESENPDCLVVGYDTELDYAKLCVATRLLFAGKPYFATHPDKTCITVDGLLPDIAATIAGLAAVTGRLPTYLGKPERAMVDGAAQRLGIADPTRLAMVGDQLDTDMTMAKRHGLTAILVMSGETTPDALARSPIQPDLVVSDVGALADLLDAAGTDLV